jgi:deoxyribonuclease IV
MIKRIGMHLRTAGGMPNAVERAKEIGANTFQIFPSSPRMLRAPEIGPKQGERIRELRARLDVGPLVIHAGRPGPLRRPRNHGPRHLLASSSQTDH